MNTSTASTQLEVRYFANLREALGASDTVDWSGGTVAELRAALRARSASHHEWLDPALAVHAAVNQRMVGEDARVEVGDEVAFFPPVTGG
jgi:molybdopterin synthase sulfur carrier subunit